MFKRFEQAIHAVHPSFVFSDYYLRPAPEICDALHTPDVRFLLVDDRHYYEDGAARGGIHVKLTTTVEAFFALRVRGTRASSAVSP